MTIQTFAGGVLWPNRGSAASATPFAFAGSSPAINISSSSEKAAIIFQAASTEPISGCWFRVGTVTSGTSITVTLETVTSSDGRPTGTLASTSATATVTIASTEDNLPFTATFTGAHTPAKGDLLAMVWAMNSTVGSLVPFCSVDNTPEDNLNFPYFLTYDSGAWTKFVNGSAKCVAINYSGTYYHHPGMFPASAINTHTYNNTSSTDVYGARFYLSAPATLTGWWGYMDLDGSANVKVYDDDGTTVLGTIALNPNLQGVSTSAYIQERRFSTGISLEATTTYRIGLEADSTTSLSFYSFDVSSSGFLGNFIGGSNFIFTSAKDPAGTTYWTDNGTRVPYMGLRLNGFDDAVSTQTGGVGSLVGGTLAK